MIFNQKISSVAYFQEKKKENAAYIWVRMISLDETFKWLIIICFFVVVVVMRGAWFNYSPSYDHSKHVNESRSCLKARCIGGTDPAQFQYEHVEWYYDFSHEKFGLEWQQCESDLRAENECRILLHSATKQIIG